MRMKKDLLLVIVLASFLASCATSIPSPQNDPQDRRLGFENTFPLLSVRGILLGETTTLLERMERYHVPGVSIAVINDYELEWAMGYGVQDAQGSQPVTPETIFPPASIGKTLTAAAALHYVELGLLDLDRDVNEMLVSWEVPENEFTASEDVTLRRLLSHTAGVSQSGFKGYLQGQELPSLAQILDGEHPANNWPIRVESVPGTQWRYSGGGYQIVEQLLIDTTGMSFPDLMQEAVLGPAGMASTIYAVELPEELRNRTVSAHGRWGQPIVGKWVNTPFMGAGGGWTTATDLAIFANEIMLSMAGLSNRIFSQEMTNLMVAPEAEGMPFMGPVSMDWGLGWQLNELGGERFISHGGDFMEGYQNLLVAVPDRGWGVVIMTNAANGDALRMEILYALAVQYDILPSLGQITLQGYLVLLVLSLLVAGVSAFAIRRARLRRSPDSVKRDETMPARSLVLPLVVTAVIVSILYYAVLALVLGFLAGPPRVSAAEAAALGKVEQGESLADHGLIEEALVVFSEIQQLRPEVEIPAQSWNHLCIRGSVWGYAAEVMDACELAVSLVPDDDGMLFGRGLSRALTGDPDGAIADFEVYVEWTIDNGFYDPYGIEIEAFISELEAGRNPFDEQQLGTWR